MTPPSIGWKPFTTRRDVASVRVRCLVPQQILASRGWRSELFNVARPGHHDVVVFQKAYEAGDLDLAEQLSARGVRIVFDLCDNHFHTPGERPELVARAERLRRMIDLADGVTVSSPLLGDLVDKKRTFLIDDALDPVAAAGRMRRGQWFGRRMKGVRLTWFGNAGSEEPAFGLVDVARIVPDLNRLHRHLPLSLTVVTNSKDGYRRHLADAQFPTRFVPWSLPTFPATHAAAEMCLLPITINPFTVCKTSNRVVTSLMLGTPAVADLIPSYEEFVPYILVGDWEANIERYARDPELRRSHVEAGQEFIRRRFDPAVAFEQWSRALTAVVG